MDDAYFGDFIETDSDCAPVPWWRTMGLPDPAIERRRLIEGCKTGRISLDEARAALGLVPLRRTDADR